MRDHEPIVLTEFNGLWQRGDRDATPIDHFTECQNIKYIGTGGFKTRDGVGISQTVAVPLSNVKRIYNYPTQTANTLIVLTYDEITGAGSIHHVVNATTVHGPLLTITGMTDFAFVPYAGRGYISPFNTFVTGDLNIEKGLQNQFLYVYAGDGTAARKAAGTPLTGNMTIANGAAGFTDAGDHIFGVVGETSSGALLAPGALEMFTTSAAFSVSFSVVPVGGATVVKRHIVASKVINNYNGNLEGYQLFFIPNATINDNVTTVLLNISFFDADLLDDASHLIDNYAEIPAGAAMCIYHNRLCIFATFTDISLGLVSEPGEPEAISQIDGLIIMPLDGNPITNGAELRDILYVFKRSRTGAFADNNDVPSSWPYNVVDTALGTGVHGIATVLDSGGASVDYLIICTYQGVTLFNGRYITPELSFKIEEYWRTLERNEWRKIQIINAPIQKEIYITTPTKRLLSGNYGNGMDPKKIKWVPNYIVAGPNTIAVANIDEIILGCDI